MGRPPRPPVGADQFPDMIGPAPVPGQMQPNVQIGVGFALHQGGAFPSEQILDTLERHAPGSVARVVAMAERAQQAQIEAATLAQEYARADVIRGSWQGMGVTVLAMLAALICGLLGHEGLGTVFLGVPVVSVARALILAVRPREAPPQNP